MREPLTWPGGVRQSASGLVVEVLTDEGICGIGEAPGPTLPTIRTIIEQELTQFLVGQDPLRTEWLVHRMEEFSRNWNRIAAYAISGLEIALLDLKGKVLGAPVVELLGGVCSDRVPVVGYLFIDVPAAIKWIRGLEKFDLQYVEQPVPDFDVAGLAQVRRSVSVPIAADEACTDVRSALELVKQDACDVFVVYPSEAGGLTRARQIAGIAEAAGKWCAIGSWAELGPATIANAHLAAA